MRLRLAGVMFKIVGEAFLRPSLFRGLLGEQLINYFPVDVSEPEITPLKAVG